MLLHSTSFAIFEWIYYSYFRSILFHLCLIYNAGEIFFCRHVTIYEKHNFISFQVTDLCNSEAAQESTPQRVGFDALTAFYPTYSTQISFLWFFFLLMQCLVYGNSIIITIWKTWKSFICWFFCLYRKAMYQDSKIRMTSTSKDNHHMVHPFLSYVVHSIHSINLAA